MELRDARVEVGKVHEHRVYQDGALERIRHQIATATGLI
jgi:hypothetical protein